MRLLRMAGRPMLLLILMATPPLTALAQGKVPVFLATTVDADDQVGRQIVFELKEAIRGSQGFLLEEEPTAWPYLKVFLVTLKTRPSRGTAISYSLLYDHTSMPLNGAFITSVVQTCGPSEVVSCARTALGQIDQAIEDLQRSNPEFRRTLSR